MKLIPYARTNEIKYNSNETNFIESNSYVNPKKYFLVVILVI